MTASGRPSPLWPLALFVGLLVGLSSVGLRPNPVAGQDAPAEEAVRQGTPTPTRTPSQSTPGASAALQTPTPSLEADSKDRAIDLIWSGEFDEAEQILRVQLAGGGGGADRAELLVYLAFVASIRQQNGEARGLLREALELRPGLDLSSLQFPRALRDLLTDVRDELRSQRVRPKPGSLVAPAHVLAPEGTPLAWGKASKKWYRRWYVWAGVGAAAVVAIAVLRGDDSPRATPTGTPVSTPTPTLTPTIRIFELTVDPQVPDCDGVTGPNKGATVHRFAFPEGPDVQIHDVFISVKVQGDYDGDEPDEFVRIIVEGQFPRFSIGPGTPYCGTLTTELRSQSRQEIVGLIQNAARDGFIDISVQPARNGGVDGNCEGSCAPFHEVSLMFTYTFR